MSDEVDSIKRRCVCCRPYMQSRQAASRQVGRQVGRRSQVGRQVGRRRQVGGASPLYVALCASSSFLDFLIVPRGTMKRLFFGVIGEKNPTSKKKGLINIYTQLEGKYCRLQVCTYIVYRKQKQVLVIVKFYIATSNVSVHVRVVQKDILLLSCVFRISHTLP